MKKLRNTLIAVIFCLFGLNAYSTTIPTEVDNSDKLVIVWTSDNPELAKTMVFMYARNAKRNNWFDEVTLIIWGPSAKLTAENEDIQKDIAQLKEAGVKIEVCVTCARMYGVDDKLRELGYDVRGMGAPLTNYLKKNYKVLTF
jgi:hypothetical protein